MALEPNKGLGILNELFEAQALEPVIDRRFALSEVPQAIERFGAAEHVGKIVVVVGDEG